MVSLRLPDSDELDVADPRSAVAGHNNRDRDEVLDRIRNDLDYYLNSSLSDLVIAAIEPPSLDLLNASSNNLTGLMSAEHVSDRLYRHGLAMSAVYCIAYVLVFVVGLIGNSFVIAVVYRSPRMRTVTNFFIVNLAVADILVIVFCLPATLMSNILVREYQLYEFTSKHNKSCISRAAPMPPPPLCNPRSLVQDLQK